MQPEIRAGDGSRLAALARLADEARAAVIAADARALATRVVEGLFYVACVGQFKRGKSTLLNALVGRPILPTGVVPVTAVVTVLRHGEKLAARVRFATGVQEEISTADIAAYVSEEQNPENQKGVVAVELFVPSELLASGMCLVDTPGIGSVFAGNTATTRSFVPHIDAALVVLGADPPISGEEAALVEELGREVHHLVFVLNKADRLTETERREAAAFARRVLSKRLGRMVGPIFEVSAAERLSGVKRGEREGATAQRERAGERGESGAGAGPERDWPKLERELGTLAREAGSDLVRAAEERGLRSLTASLLRELEEQRGALVRPVEESEQRIEVLHRCVAEAEQSLLDLGALLAAEQGRLSRTLGEQRQRFLAIAIPTARQELREAIERSGERRRRRLWRLATELAQDKAKEWLDRWLEKEQPRAEELYRQGAQRFIKLANDFLARLAASGTAGLEGLEVLGPETGFRTKGQLYYTSLLRLTSRSAAGVVLTYFRTSKGALEAVVREAGDYLEELIFANSSRIQYDLDERVGESRKRLEAEIRARLHEVSASAERALEQARAMRAAGAEAVRAELDRIAALRRSTEALAPTVTQAETS